MPDHPIFKKAREESKGGYVQHVNSGELDKENLHSSDWYAGSDTLVSYHGGREINRNYQHPLLSKHREAMNKEEAADA